jgi:uncharacterized protein YdhG (YjbR/CyaY superfamily)
MQQVKDIDEYLALQPEELMKKLQKVRETIRKAAPEAEEVISYQMPAYKYKGILVYFAGFKNHIGFFPTASGIAAFKDKLTEYQCSKGTIRFPDDKPIPFDLITEIVRFRVLENTRKSELKKKK